MSETVITLENVFKQYRIGARQGYETFRESLIAVCKAPFKVPGKESGRAAQLTGKTLESNTIWALKDISFEVKRGEVVGVIGRNGAGKSTLLKILSRITDPTKGRIEMIGRVGSLLEVGTGFHPELSGHENIYLYGAILGMDRYEVTRKFDEIVAFAEIEQFIDTPVKRYSTGMYMRLAFAVAAHLEPDILLVDEVLAVGDAAFQKKCLGKMGDVSKNEGRTVLFVSHNMASIQQLCSKVILLRAGEIAEVGSPSRVTELYLGDGVETSLIWNRAAPPSSEASAYFERIFVTDTDGAVAPVVTSRDSVQIAVEFVLRRKCQSLQLSINIHTHSGDVIFASAPRDSDVEVPHDPGTYRALIQLPPGVLLARTYALSASMYMPYAGGTIEDVSCFQFNVQNSDSFSSRIPDGRSGNVGILCRWAISKT